MENRSRFIWAGLGVTVLALLAGVVIASLGNERGDASPYTPRPVGTPTAIWAATPAPTATLTRSPATPTPTHSATPAPTHTAAPTATPLSALALVHSGPANLRSGPGPDYPVLFLATEGVNFPVTARSPDAAWWQVCCVNGSPAWVASSVISVTGSLEALPVLDR